MYHSFAFIELRWDGKVTIMSYGKISQWNQSKELSHPVCYFIVKFFFIKLAANEKYDFKPTNEQNSNIL